MKKIISTTFSTLLIIILSTGCDDSPQIIKEKTNHSIEGHVQKGPFISGSSLTIYELSENLSPTGMSFNCPVQDNQGGFSIEDIPLDTTFIKLRADGFYFNEISGKLSDAQITLYALADLAATKEVNINLLTHMEYQRAEYLFKQGYTLKEAKEQAQKEVLAIFNIQKDTISSSEKMNIINKGEDNGVLLAITSIIQGFRSESEMTELLYSIINDIKEDGTLDDPSLGSSLLNQAIYLDTTSISENLKARYSNEGYTPELPNYPKFIDHFIATTDFQNTELIIKYPETGLYGENILAPNSDTILGRSYRTNPNYSLCAELPRNTSLKIKISALSSSDTSNTNKAISLTPTNDVIRDTTASNWFYQPSTNINWQVSQFDMENYTQTFTVIAPEQTSDVSVTFDPGRFLIEYFEMGATEPGRQKILNVIVQQ